MPVTHIYNYTSVKSYCPVIFITTLSEIINLCSWYKYNIIFLKRNYEIKLGPLNLTPEEPSQAWIPRATWAKPVRRGITRWSMRVWSVPSGFIKIVLDVFSVWAPLSAFVLRSPAEVNLSPLGGDDTSSSPPLAGSQTWWPVPPWSKISIRGAVTLPYSKGSAQGWGSPESYSGVWGYWFIPPLLSKPIFGQPPL